MLSKTGRLSHQQRVGVRDKCFLNKLKKLKVVTIDVPPTHCVNNTDLRDELSKGGQHCNRLGPISNAHDLMR